MIPAAEIGAGFQRALDERWGYIWGESGAVWTEAKQRAATRDMTKRYGNKWIGRPVADCSGMYVWIYRQHGEKIYHGSNTIWNKYLSHKGPLIGTMEIRPHCEVFKVKNGRRVHIGHYMGGGRVIEAMGTINGVVESDLSTWDEWGELALVDYTGIVPEMVEIKPKTVRKGDTGEIVRSLQKALNGFEGLEKLTEDGIFGSATLQAVRTFQAQNGLDVDGIAGPMTWEALRTALGNDEDDIEPPEIAQPDEDGGEQSVWERWMAMPADERFADLYKRVVALEGGDADG